MRKFSKLFLLLLPFVACISCMRDVPSGYVGVKVFLLGGSKGVNSEVVGVGRYFIGWNEKLYLFPVYKVTKVWTHDKAEDSSSNEEMEFQTKEGLSVNADIGLIYSVDSEKAGILFQTFNRGIDEITNVYLRSRVRDGLNRVGSEYAVEDIYGPKKSEIIDRVRVLIQDDLKQKGLIVDKLYFVNSIRLPDNVQQAINAKIEATQKAQQRENEVAEAQANAQKKIAEAQGEAQALRLKASAITPLNLEMKKLEIMEKAIDKWQGQVPQTILPGQTVPFVNFK